MALHAASPLGPAGWDGSAALDALPAGTPVEARAAVADARARSDDAAALVEAFRSAEGVAAPFALAAARGGFALGPAPEIRAYASFEAALSDLAAVAGLALDEETRAALPAWERIPADLKAPVLDLVAATVTAARLRDEAFAALSADDEAYLQEIALGLPDGQARLLEPRFLDLAQRVDHARLAQAGQVVTLAIDRNVPLLEAAKHQLPADLPTVRSPHPACGPAPFTLAFLISIGNGVPECFSIDVVLSIDLGGDDLYVNNAGGTHSGLAYGVPNLVPVGVALDLSGTDAYHSPSPLALGPAAPTQRDYGVAGAGVLGVGVLVDIGDNDDFYHSSHTLPCMGAPDFSDVLTQGSGFLGVGVLADVGGLNNAYSSNNFLGAPQCAAPVTYEVAFSQGSAVYGLGLLFEGPRADSSLFASANALMGDAPGGSGLRFVVDHAQGAATGLGAGLLVSLPSQIDQFVSGNKLTFGGPAGPAPDATLTVRCSQGAAGLCGALPPTLASPILAPLPAHPLALGALVRVGGNDLYLCQNTVEGGAQPTLLAEVVQGAAGGAGAADAGLLVDALSVNCFLSDNVVKGKDATMAVRVAQGAAQVPLPFAGRSGTLVGLLNGGQGGDRFISGNQVRDTGSIAQLVVDLVQGAATGFGAAGALVETPRGLGGGVGSESYNSRNTVTGVAGNVMSVTRMQGFAEGDILAAGVMLDLDLDGQDTFNSGNGLAPLPPVALIIASGLGATGTPGAFGFGLGVGAFVNVGGADTYNANPVPPPLTVLTDVHGVAPLFPAVALFADVGRGWFDTYTPTTGTAPCSGLAAVFFDGLDAPGDASPPFVTFGPGLVCLDL